MSLEDTWASVSPFVKYKDDSKDTSKAPLQNTHFFRNLLFTQRTCPPAPLLPSKKTFGGNLVRAKAEATPPPKNVKGKISHDLTFQGPRTVSTGMANGFQPKWPL